MKNQYDNQYNHQKSITTQTHSQNPNVPKPTAKVLERKTAERFVLPFLVLVLFITGLIISLINMTNANNAVQQRYIEHSNIHINQTAYPDAGCRYCHKTNEFILET
ncbi:MAG: hypothetical protein FWE13_03805 [Firmicutes bacterium]|nr:hypothetical protein [Bacillota bacterium]